MSKKEIIEEIAREGFIENSLKKFSNSPYIDDLAQDLYIELLMKDDNVIIGLYNRNELKYYIIKMIKINIISKTSPFFTKYEKFRKITNDIDEQKNKI